MGDPKSSKPGLRVPITLDPVKYTPPNYRRIEVPQCAPDVDDRIAELQGRIFCLKQDRDHLKSLLRRLTSHYRGYIAGDVARHTEMMRLISMAEEVGE